MKGVSCDEKVNVDYKKNIRCIIVEEVQDMGPHLLHCVVHIGNYTKNLSCFKILIDVKILNLR